MPLASLEPLSPDPDRFAAAADAAPTSWGMGFNAAWKSGQLFDPRGWIFADDQRAFDADLKRMTGYSEKLSIEEANETYGVDGELTFDKPLLASEAAWKQRAAYERTYQRDVLTNTEIGPLGIMAASFGGSMLDPAALPLFLAPELLGVGKLAVAGARALRGGKAIAAAGRLATAGRWALEGGIEGVVGGTLYEGVNWGLRREAGEDYTGGDALRNLVLGGVMGAGFKGAAGALFGGTGLGGLVPERLRKGRRSREAMFEDIASSPETRLPPEIEALPEDMRGAALVAAIDQIADDQPVTVGKLVERQRTADLAQLDETRSLGGEPVKGRFLQDDVAITTRGTEIPVRYAVVELDDLITSHDNDLSPNPEYPQALQPRARDRAGAVARNRQLQAELNPARLMREVGAESGAPIIAADGTVESGNGRTIALRRAAAEGDEAWGRYRAELEARDVDTAGMEKPVLVRVRTNAMTGEERAALALEMNADVTERLSVAEQAMADAAKVDDALLSVIGEGDLSSATNRGFVRTFLQRVAGDQINTLADAEGRLSQAGMGRLKAAMVAHAFGDARLVEAVFEAADSSIASIGQALAPAAPGWSRMKGAIARGLAPAELDVTPNIRSAVDLVRHARENRRPLGELIAQRIDQIEMFGGESISPETEAFLRLFFRDEDFKRPRSAAKIAAALDDYSRRAAEIAPGPDLFGETPDGAARRILADLRNQLDAAGDDAGGDLLERLRADDAPAPTPEPVVVGVRGDSGDGLRPQGGEGAGGESGRVEALVLPEKGRRAPAARLSPELQPDGRWKLRYEFNTKVAGAAGAMSGDFATADEALRAGAERLRQQLGNDTDAPALKIIKWLDGLGLDEPAPGVAEAPAKRVKGAQPIIAADPELKALHDDIEALRAVEGVELETAPTADPDILAEAVRAAGFCIGEGGLG